MRQLRGHAIAVFAGAGLALLPCAALAQSADPSADADAVAGFESAGGLLKKCRENSTYARSYCFSYLAAVADSARAYRIWIGSGDPCLPAGLTMGKLADTFEAFLIDNPSLTRSQAASVVVASLQEAYPCPVRIAPPTAMAPAPAPSDKAADDNVDRRPQDQR
jgi:hypothetical protein